MLRICCRVAMQTLFLPKRDHPGIFGKRGKNRRTTIPHFSPRAARAASSCHDDALAFDIRRIKRNPVVRVRICQIRRSKAAGQTCLSSIATIVIQYRSKYQIVSKFCANNTYIYIHTLNWERKREDVYLYEFICLLFICLKKRQKLSLL